MKKELDVSSPEFENTMNEFMRYLMLARNNGELDLFVALFQTDYRIMQYLASHQDAHPSQMAEELQVTRPNIAATMRLLEQKDYIIRTTNSNNRREVYVNLTEEGKEYLSRCEMQMKFLFAGWFTLLGKEETDHLINILKVSTDPKVMTEGLKQFHFGE